jgi:hypothetical protein
MLSCFDLKADISIDMVLVSIFVTAQRLRKLLFWSASGKAIRLTPLLDIFVY